MIPKGIALIQVLLITALLSVFALYLTGTAKDQITIAKWSEDKAQALVAMHSAESELLFTLLTQRKRTQVADDLATNPLTQQWNFFAKPFVMNQVVSVKVQDLAGLLHIHFINRENFLKFIISQGHNEMKASEIVDNLLDWQDTDNIPRLNGTETSGYLANRALSQATIRNGAVPYIRDLIYVNQFSPELVDSLSVHSTIYGQGYFNPMTATPEILSALVGESLAIQIITLRDNNKLTQEFLTQSAGFREDDNTFFYPSNHLSIELTSKIGETQVKKNIIIHLSAYATDKKQPFNILASRG